MPSGQQKPAEQEAQGNGGAQKTPGADGEAPGNGAAVINPSKAPHQSGGAKQGADNGEGKGPNHEASGPSWQRFFDKIFDDPVAFFTVWVAVFTAVLAVSTIGLWRQTRRLAEQAVEASRDTKRSIEAAERSADETARAAQAAVEAAGSERAWMSFNGFRNGHGKGLLNNQYFDHICTISMDWINSGRSPAIRSNVFVQCIIVNIDADLPEFDEISHDSTMGTLIGPTIKCSSSQWGFGGEDWQNFKNRKTAIAISSTVIYEVVGDLGNPKMSQVAGKMIYDSEQRDRFGNPVFMLAFNPQGKNNMGT